MSKAFTRESDDLPDQPLVPRPASPLPPGAKNYVTAAGAAQLRAELERLRSERPALAAAAQDPGAKAQLMRLDQRMVYLQQSLQTAVVVSPPAPAEDRVRFGASVTVRDRSGAESCYRLVGVDEADPDRGWVSWLSPIAKALLNARRGDRVRFRLPSGDEELESVAVGYE